MVADIHLHGLNHRTAPLSLRENLVRSLGPVDEALRRLRGTVEECVILSTCNRLEVYVHGDNGHDPFAVLAPDAAAAVGDHVYRHSGPDCISHLMNVASSLDSLVIGETQIIGQVREAYELARSEGTAGRRLHTLFQSALAAAKEVQTETGLGRGHLSLGSIVVDLSRQVWERPERHRVLVLGSGQMGEALMHAFRDAGINDIVLSSRTRDNANALGARFGCRVVDWDRWRAELPDADICVTAVSSDEPILGKENLMPVCEDRNRPLLVVDISIPRNVALDVDGLPNLYRYDMDGLAEIRDETSRSRQAEIDTGRSILSRHAAGVVSRLSLPELGEVFRRLDARREDMIDEELGRLKHQLDDAQLEIVRRALHRYGNRLLHPIRSEAGEVVNDPVDLERLLFGRESGGC